MRVKDWYGSLNISNYGPLELKEIKDKNGSYCAQVKLGTYVKHGRCIYTHKNGIIIDAYYFDDKYHGPFLIVFQNGSFEIREYQNGNEMKVTEYKVDGALF